MWKYFEILSIYIVNKFYNIMKCNIKTLIIRDKHHKRKNWTDFPVNGYIQSLIFLRQLRLWFGKSIVHYFKKFFQFRRWSKINAVLRNVFQSILCMYYMCYITMCFFRTAMRHVIYQSSLIIHDSTHICTSHIASFLSY